MASKTQENFPSVLSFQKSVYCTDGVFENAETLIRTCRSIQGQEGGKKKEGDTGIVGIFNQEYCRAVDDKVKVSFGIVVTPFLKERIKQVNDVEAYEKLNDFIRSLAKKDYLRENANYIAYNVLNGRWLWRNRVLSEKIEIRVFDENGNVVAEVDDALNIPENIEIDANGKIVSLEEDVYKKEVVKLGEAIYSCMTQNDEIRRFKVEAILHVIKGQNLYPSETFNDKNKSDISREFLKNEEGVPLFSEEKIWNALRTYDVWYKKDDVISYEKLKEPISIEVYGGNIKFQEIMRSEKQYFAEMLKKALNGKEEELSDDDKRYMVACLIRGAAITKSKE
jgi:CRISPR-associated protein Csy3